MNRPHFLIEVESYNNDGLNLALILHARSTQETSGEFDALLKFNYDVEIEPDLCVKDADTRLLELEIKKNTLLPENELDFFNAGTVRYYEFKKYSPAAQELEKQVRHYLSDTMSRITFKIILNPEEAEQG